jgi:pimeloyl-ACP methyl ester carboxylesterase
LGRKILNGIPVYIYHGLADETAPPSHAELYAHAIPHAQLCRLPGRDHQLDNDLREIAAVIEASATSSD